MPRDPSSIPSDLRDRLREEPDEEQSDLEAVWSLLGTTDPSAGEDPAPDEAWDTVADHHPELGALDRNGLPEVHAQDGRDGRHPRRSRRSARPPARHRRRRWGWGIVLVALLLVGGAWLWRQPVTVSVPAGQQETVTLPDGSTVELNSETTLQYRRDFQAWPFVPAERRVVRLKGEAFFDVSTSERPFAVETFNAQVAVTGTRFNVRARADDEPTTEVTLASGKVQLSSSQQHARSVLLKTPGQTSRITGTTAEPTAPTKADVNHVLAWRDDGFAVRDRPLAIVVHELERRFDVPIRVHPSVDRPKAPLSLYYPEPTDLETILHDMCMARDLNYRPIREGFEIFDASGEE